MNQKTNLTVSAAKAVVIGLAGTISAAAASWQKLPALPESNGGASMGAVAGQIVVVGGTNWRDGTKHWLKTVHRYDPSTSQWTSRETLPEPFAYGMVTMTDGALVVLGGTTGSAPFAGSIRVEPKQVTSRMDGGIKVPAVLSAGGRIGDEFIFTGGTDDAANTSAFRRDTFAVNLATGAQRTLPLFPGKPMGMPGTVVTADELFIFGGCAWDSVKKGALNLSESYALSVRRNTWRALKPLPQAVRGLAAVLIDDQHVYLAGGFTDADGGFTDAAWIYDLTRDTYTPSAPLPYRAVVTLVLNDGYVYCLGGEDRGKHRSDAAFRIPVSALK